MTGGLRLGAARGAGSPLAALLGCLAALGAGAPTAEAAGAPEIGQVWASKVQSSSARLHAEINPNASATGYHVTYITEPAYQSNLAAGADGFAGAKRLPAVGDSPIGSGSEPIAVLRPVSGLSAGSAYRYRFVAQNADGQAVGPVLRFVTFAQPDGAPDSCPNATARRQTGAVDAGLLDCRAYELVSPVDKNGGRVDPPGSLSHGGVLQAASGGGAITYGSAASFGAGAQGAPGASQYIARRTSGGWSTENITVAIFSGSFWDSSEGVPYRLFSPDLARGLLLSGRHCRGEETDCPVPNPPLQGADAPAGYQNYYLRESAGPSFEALLGSADIAGLGLDPTGFSLSFAGGSPDLRHVILSTCAALTADATEAPGGEGCDPADPNLYIWSGAGLTLVNLLPGDEQGSPGAVLAASAGAVSAGGTRVYWSDLASGNLYLRSTGATTQVDAAVGGGGSFETASADGSVAFFTKGGHLHRYRAATATSTDLTPAGGVEGVLGASGDGGRVYYATGDGLFLWDGGTSRQVAAAAGAANYPPASGAARVSADGRLLLFLSDQSLTGYDNAELTTGSPTTQLFLYDDSGAGTLTCLSCNPTNGRPIGSSSIPGAVANGIGAAATLAYKPRALASDGRRVFFDSEDALVLTDTNSAPDVYQWQAKGTGSCTRADGCVALLSSGRSAGGATLVDVSADGADAFFLTLGSLVDVDPGAMDLYDARAGGGFPRQPAPIPCIGDSCQSLPPEPHDPAIGSLIAGRGNPEVRYRGATRNCRQMTRRAVGVRRRAIRTKRRARRAASPRQARRLRSQAAKLQRRIRVTRRAAKRCRAANRRAAR
ncbi:MAG: hypothetical protein WDZ46_09185 [Solirubrobacterales bacterium]